MTKQLFGRIEKVIWKDGYIATAHTALRFDSGCVCVRKYEDDLCLPVVFSKVEDRLLAIDLDFTASLLVVLEWAGTFYGVPSGHVNLFAFLEDSFLVDLREFLPNVTYSALKISAVDDVMVTVGHDRTVRSKVGLRSCIDYGQGPRMVLKASHFDGSAKRMTHPSCSSRRECGS